MRKPVRRTMSKTLCMIGRAISMRVLLASLMERNTASSTLRPIPPLGSTPASRHFLQHSATAGCTELSSLASYT